MTDKPNYQPGLEGIIAGESAICKVRADVDKLIYRGYDTSVLALEAEFEETAHLLIEGRLPNKVELSAFKKELNTHRIIEKPTIELIRALPNTMHPMDVLRCGVSACAGWDPDVGDNSHDANVRKAIRLTSKIPVILGVRQAHLEKRNPVYPDPTLNHAGNLLWLLNGKKPDEDAIRIMNTSLTLYAEHGFNASTFTARVCASTLSDLHSAITGAIGTLKGPLHGGANEAAMAMLEVIGDASKAEAWVMEALAQKKKIMGFGHRVYRTCDSRSVTLKAEGLKLAQKRGDTKYSEIAEVVEQTMKREKNLFTNVDFPCAWVYKLLGLPVDTYTPIFAAARVTGWSAHVIEQHDNNRLIRPSEDYTGPMEMEYKKPE
ncbi:MAG: citrate synthase [Candidatus Omnitrophica bacterium]|nr:citrate synthase [Candidatus Omnitrophota bacterium]